MTTNAAPKPAAPKTEKTEIPAQAEAVVTEVIVEEDCTDGEVDNSKLGKLKAALKKHRNKVIGITAGVAFAAYVIIKNINTDDETPAAEGETEDSTS